jgi:hypothetical protein
MSELNPKDIKKGGMIWSIKEKQQQQKKKKNKKNQKTKKTSWITKDSFSG